MAKLLVGVVLLLVLAAGAAFGFYKLKVGEAVTALKADLAAVEAEKVPRPLFAAPMTKGSFSACAEGRLASFSELPEPAACKAFRAPKTPAAKMPDECLAVVTPKNSLAWARGLMACSHGDAGGATGKVADQLDAFVTAARVLAWEIRGQVGSGGASASLDTCLDVFGTARDLVPHLGAKGVDAAFEVVTTVYPPCTDAVVSADGPSRKAFHNALETIRQGRWTNAKLVRDERVAFGTAKLGHLLTPPKGVAPSMPYEQEWKAAQQLQRSKQIEAIADTLDPERSAQLQPGEGDLLKKADRLDALLEMLAAAAGTVDKPATNSRFTVAPAEPGLLLTPTAPEDADYAIHLLR